MNFGMMSTAALTILADNVPDGYLIPERFACCVPDGSRQIPCSTIFYAPSLGT